MVNLEKPSIRKAVNIPASRPHQYPKSDFQSLLLHGCRLRELVMRHAYANFPGIGKVLNDMFLRLGNFHFLLETENS